MIIDNKNTTENTIYNAYGYTVNAIEAIYRWTYDNSNREQKCYTMVSVLDSKNVEIFRYNGFNNPTFADILKKTLIAFYGGSKPINRIYTTLRKLFTMPLSKILVYSHIE